MVIPDALQVIIAGRLRQRSSGSPVDVRGEAVAIAERMGILSRLRQAATDVAGMRFIDVSGKVAARVDSRARQRASGSRDVEIARGDLSTILHEASQDSAELLFDDAIRFGRALTRQTWSCSTHPCRRRATRCTGHGSSTTALRPRSLARQARGAQTGVAALAHASSACAPA
jgi:hypothetical protein